MGGGMEDAARMDYDEYAADPPQQQFQAHRPPTPPTQRINNGAVRSKKLSTSIPPDDCSVESVESVTPGQEFHPHIPPELLNEQKEPNKIWAAIPPDTGWFQGLMFEPLPHSNDTMETLDCGSDTGEMEHS